MAKGFVCIKCKSKKEIKPEPIEELCDGVETVDSFCYLGDRLDSHGGCESAVTARMRLGWRKFRECGDLLRGKRYSLKTKGKVYRTCVRSAMLYGSETWCLREKELDIMRRTERAMIRSMCGVKIMDRKNTEELMDMLGLSESLDKLAKASGVRWYGHVQRREDNDILKEALNFRVYGKRKIGRPKMTWRIQVEKEFHRIGLRKEDALIRTKWKEGVKTLAMRTIRPPPAMGTQPNSNWKK